MYTVIIQARTGGQRLPGKVLENICGVPMIARIVYRLSHTFFKKGKKYNCRIVVATPETDAKIANVLRSHFPANIYSGRLACESPNVEDNDVLKRFAEVAKKYNAESIIRITGDCPFIDPALIEEGMRIYEETDYNFVTLGPGYPEGLDFEIFDSELLFDADENATSVSDREHVTPYIWKGKVARRVNQYYMDCGSRLSHHSWSVDTQDDLKFAKLLYHTILEFDKNYRVEWDTVDNNSGFLKIIDVLNKPANHHLYEHSVSKSVNQKYLDQEGVGENWADYRYGRKQS